MRTPFVLGWQQQDFALFMRWDHGQEGEPTLRWPDGSSVNERVRSARGAAHVSAVDALQREVLMIIVLTVLAGGARYAALEASAYNIDRSFATLRVRQRQEGIK